MRATLWFLLGLAAAGTVRAQLNTDPGSGAAPYYWGQQAITTMSTGSAFWFKLTTVAGRSYCAEIGNANNYPFGDRDIDPEIAVFRGDGITPIVSNDDATDEPRGAFLSRACFIAQFSEDARFRVRSHAAVLSPATFVTVRFIETTLFCPWFFIAGDYNAFSLIRNTSQTALVGVVTWRGLGGAVAGTTPFTLPANGTAILNARDFVNPALVSNGSVEVAHTGAPDQLKGSTTTISGTTGLGFDALFESRKPW